jgi:hypothetical protein
MGTIKTELFLLARGASAETTPLFFSTGKVSPVKAASSIKSSFDSSNKLSAGIISPAASTTISPEQLVQLAAHFPHRLGQYNILFAPFLTAR